LRKLIGHVILRSPHRHPRSPRRRPGTRTFGVVNELSSGLESVASPPSRRSRYTTKGPFGSVSEGHTCPQYFGRQSLLFRSRTWVTASCGRARPSWLPLSLQGARLAPASLRSCPWNPHRRST